MKRFIIAAALAAGLGGCADQHNPLADAPVITINPDTGQATSGPPTVAPADEGPLGQLAYAIANKYGPDNAQAINLATGPAKANVVDAVGLSCWTDLAALSNDLSAQNAANPAKDAGALSKIERLRLLLLQFRGQAGNPLLLQTINSCVVMAQETRAMGIALPLEFRDLMTQMMLAALEQPAGAARFVSPFPSRKSRR